MNFSAWNTVVETVYATAVEPRRWPETIQVIADLLDARGGTLLFRDDTGRVGAIVSPSLIDLSAQYQADWAHRDVRADYVFAFIASGQHDVAADHHRFSEAEAAGLPIYRDFLWPNGLGWGMGVSVSPRSNVAVALTLLRARGLPGFDAAAREQLLALSRHVERALSLSVRLMDAEAERLGLAEGLDRIACGAFILDASMRVLFANRTAEQVLGAGLVLAAGRLCATDRAAQQTLRAHIEAVIGGAGPGTPTPLIVPGGGRNLIVQILPLRPYGATPALRTASAVVLVEAQDRERPFDPAMVRDAFSLTLGEARLASLVGTGARPVEAATALGITEATARTVLKRVFAKMDVSSQSEMAALMGRLFMLRRQDDALPGGVPAGDASAGDAPAGGAPAGGAVTGDAEAATVPACR